MVDIDDVRRRVVSLDQTAIDDLRSEVLESKRKLLVEANDFLESNVSSKGIVWSDIDNRTYELSVQREQLYRGLAKRVQRWQVYSYLVLLLTVIFLFASVAGVSAGTFWTWYGGILSVGLIVFGLLSYRYLYSIYHPTLTKEINDRREDEGVR